MLRRPLIGICTFPYRSLHLKTTESNDRESISFLLQKHAQSKSIRKCKQIHSKLIISGTISDIYFTNTILNFYSRCGDLYKAHQLFENTPHKNVVTWTSMITAYVHSEFYTTALIMFKERVGESEKPNQFTFSIAIRACTNLRMLELGIQIHGLIICFGLERNEFAGSSLVDMYFKMGFHDDACWVFYGLFRRDSVSWNVMISGFAQIGDHDEVLRLFSGMRADGLNPNDFTFTSLLKCCCFEREVEQIHGFVLKSAIEFDTVVGAALVDMYGKCKNMDSGRKIFDAMVRKDGFVWSSAISGYAKNGDGEEALVLYREMHRQGMKSDQHVLSSALKACIEIQEIEAGNQIHTQMIKNGYQKDCFIASVLLVLYSGFNRMGDADKVFRMISSRDIVSWNSMIIGYAQTEEFSQKCLELFREFRRETKMKPDGVTFISVLKYCRSRLDLQTGRQIHTQVVKSSHGSESHVVNAVISMYSKCGATNDARRAFDNMVHRDEISWNSIIGHYAQNGLELDALRISKEMVVSGFHPSEFTFPSCLVACSGLADMDMGRQFHCSIIKTGFARDVYVGSSVMDMYAKSGNMEDSIKAFEELWVPNIVTFNSLISGFAQHGRADEAIQTFKELGMMDIIPNKMTFIAVLSACGHRGLVDESIFFFDLMCHKYGIEPESEHYCCLVDVFGRAGRLEDAYEIITGIQSDPGVTVWRALLSACRNYGNIKIGEKSAKRVMELEPDDHASYVLLSSLYSEAGRWKEASKLRETMAEIGVRKDPGSSRVTTRDTT
ncbi:pentatricopeptide repeat-containing protein At4g13650-like [Tasmannia lanceolata]|uniref:pentatricopeptide repeat-containing protein At4g13650-like n=1 Tax=Tasmannia lanceolata TaxID=3420 RepID=UPI00406421CF